MNLGASEILLILIVVLLLFGGKRLPELARGIGRGLAEFRRAMNEVQREINAPLSEATPLPKSTSPAEQGPAEARNPLTVNANPAAQPRIPETPPRSDT
jgi:sec-independent protein translocase protein TatA